MLKKSVTHRPRLSHICFSAWLILITAIVPLNGLAMSSSGHQKGIRSYSPSPGSSYSTTLAVPMVTPVPTPTPAVFNMTPSSGAQGKTYEVMVTSTECLQDATKRPLKGFQLYSPQGNGITVANTSATGCRLTARLTVAADATLGISKLWLTKEKEVQDTLEFTVTPIAAGPIPPGLNNKGQVDVMWSVLPDQVTHDNFGGKVASEYYTIEAVIGNDSGFDLQLASIGFTVPSFSPEDLESRARYRIPSSGYRLVRGSLQRREQLNPRNLILSGLKIAGPLLTGFTPFFHNMVHRTNFSEFINIISNPLEKGFEQAVPDTVPNELNRLADQVFRDDISTRTIIPNNAQVRVVTFVPKELLFPKAKGSKLKRLIRPSEAPKLRPYGVAPGLNTADVTNEEKVNPHNPQEVMWMLGEMVLIGEQIEHVNRIRVVTTPFGSSISDRSISGRITDQCNEPVAGVTMTLTADADFAERKVSTSPDGTYNFVNIPTGRTYTVTPALTNLKFNATSPGSETFKLEDSQSNLNFSADYVVLAITGKVLDNEKNPLKDVEVNLTGAKSGKTKTDKDGVYKLDVPASDLNLLTSELKLTPSLKDYTFASKNWSCKDRVLDFVGTKK